MLAFNINQVTTSNIGEYHDRCYFINMIEEEAKKKTLENVNYGLNDKKGIV